MRRARRKTQSPRNMKPFFSTPERQEKVDTIARSWIGTPFFQGSACRGKRGGVDCVRLAMEIMAEAGVMEREPLPDYTLDYAHHSMNSMLLRWILDCPQFAGRVCMVPPAGKIMPGDLFGLRSGRVDHHLAVAAKWNMVIHAVENVGVICHDFVEKKFTARILYVLRFFEKEDCA